MSVHTEGGRTILPARHVDAVHMRVGEASWEKRTLAWPACLTLVSGRLSLNPRLITCADCRMTDEFRALRRR